MHALQPQVLTSNAFMIGMLGVLAAGCFALGPLAMFNLYFVPYWMFVVWLDVVTYLHHHGHDDPSVKMPWYRGEVSACVKAGRLCHWWFMLRTCTGVAAEK